MPVGIVRRREIGTSITALHERRAQEILGVEVIGGVNGSQMGWKEEEEKIDGDGRHLLRRFFFAKWVRPHRLPLVGPSVAVQANVV